METRANIFRMRVPKDLGNQPDIVRRKIPWDAIMKMCGGCQKLKWTINFYICEKGEWKLRMKKT